VIWLAVLAVAIFGPDVVTTNGVGDVGERLTIVGGAQDGLRG
jgi:hypothetical protein